MSLLFVTSLETFNITQPHEFRFLFYPYVFLLFVRFVLSIVITYFLTVSPASVLLLLVFVILIMLNSLYCIWSHISFLGMIQSKLMVLTPT